MKMQVVGIQRKAGTFENRETKKSYDYDNYNLHCVGKDIEVGGQCVRVVKLKASAAADLIAACGGKPEQIIGHTVDFEFGRYDKVTNYELVK